MINGNSINIKHSYKNMMYISLVLIGVIAIYNWIITPHRNYIMAAQKHEQITSELEIKKKEVLNNIKSKRKELNSLTEQFAKANKMLFNPIEIQEFLDSIPMLVKGTGCNMDQLTFSSNSGKASKKTAKPDIGINSKNARLIVSGDYINITGLIKVIQDCPQKVYINEIKICPARNNSSQLKCDMNIIAYVMLK
ncbi:MAG: type 4a pilus biogenesis protein PilO [Planctomycetota bacterium]|jgi:Tfp pilus assembly protein PilO